MRDRAGGLRRRGGGARRHCGGEVGAHRLGLAAHALGVPPDAAWMMQYVASAQSVAQQVADSSDVQAAAQHTYAALACA
jgi:hypothetical protein